MSSDTFTPTMHQTAEAEGWWLSERDDGFYQIQTYDEDVLERFATDERAMVHVKARADAGSVFHQIALRLHGTRWKEKKRNV